MARTAAWPMSGVGQTISGDVAAVLDTTGEPLSNYGSYGRARYGDGLYGTQRCATTYVT